jgi:hypothetical protein
MIDSAIRLLVEPAHLSDIDLVAPLFDSYRQFYGAPPDLAAARDVREARRARGESVVKMAKIE